MSIEAMLASIQTTRLEKPKRGPGGHWYYYQSTARDCEHIGYGQTGHEARMDLRKKITE